MNIRLVKRVSLALALLMGLVLIGPQAAEAGKWRRHVRRAHTPAVAVHVGRSVHVHAPGVGVHVGPGVRVHVGYPSYHRGLHYPSYHRGLHYYGW